MMNWQKNDETEAVKQLRKRLFSELKWKVYCRERRNSKSWMEYNSKFFFDVNNIYKNN